MYTRILYIFYTLGYWSPENSYFGGGIGRVANRTGNATFTLNGQVHNVTPNDGGKHHLHGGLRGFDKVILHMRDNFQYTIMQVQWVEPISGTIYATFRIA